MHERHVNHGFTRIGRPVFSPNLDMYHAVFERDGKRYVGFGQAQTGDFEILPDPVANTPDRLQPA